ncbi:MAG TPA: AMP-binding protein, partial [Acidimicrobiales bacterium]|nr:AMP-binding protein [Acidimicrobiales bacterium]
VLEQRAVGAALAGLRHAVLEPARAAPGRPQLRVGLSAAPTEDGFLRQLVALLDGHALVVGAGPVDVLDCPPDRLPRLDAAGPPVVVAGSRTAVGPDERAAAARLQGSLVHHVYGPPECGFAAASELATEGGPRRTLGRPLAPVIAEVLDADGSHVALQVPGELYLGGPGLARGAGKGEPSRYHTGLVARRLPDGRIEAIGPARTTALLRGLRVDCSRIETALRGHPAVRRVSVTVEGADRRDPHLAARVVPAGDEPPTLAELRVHLWRALPGYPWPRALVVGDGAGSETDGPGPGPPTPEERLLSALWADVLGVDAVPVGANYWQEFSFLQAIARAREAGLRIADRQVSRNRTIAGLAADLAARRGRRRPGRGATS